jgi:hypothetical protein
VFISHESIPSTRIVRPPKTSSVSPSTTRETAMASPAGGASALTVCTAVLPLDARVGAAEVAVDWPAASRAATWAANPARAAVLSG